MNNAELHLLDLAISKLKSDNLSLSTIIERTSTLLQGMGNRVTSIIDKIKIINTELEEYHKTSAIELMRSGKRLDCRLLALIIDNVRRFQRVNNFPCGIDLSNSAFIDDEDTNQPMSVILLGANGVGKSSMYDALEWVCTGNIGGKPQGCH